MSFVNINDARMEGVERAERLLSGISGGADEAIKSAGQSVAAYMQSASVKAIQERYAIKAKNIRENELVRVRYSFWDGLSITINFTGRKIPLYRFNGTSPKQPGRREIVKAHVLKSTSPQPFYKSFIAKMQSGHIGIFKRESETRFPIEEKMGLSVPQMLSNDGVKEKISREAAAKFEEILEQKILDILNGRR